MKTMNKIIIALLAMASFTACDGLLNMTPEDTLSPGTFFFFRNRITVMDRWLLYSTGEC